MPPAAKKDCSIILFDLATKCKEKAIQTLIKICCNNFFANSKNLTKLVLVNSAITENRLAAQYDGYKGIFEVAKNVMIYNPGLILEMVEENKDTGESNWLEAVRVGLENLSEEYESVLGIVTYQLLFITDLTSPLENYDQQMINDVIDNIKKLQAYFYVVGPDVEPPSTIKSPDHVKSWMNNLKVDENNENLKIMQTIISDTKNSVICNFKIGLHLFFSYKNWPGTQPWKVPLAMGSKVEIPAQTMRILNEGMKCKLSSSGHRFGEVVWIDAEDETVEIDREDVRSGIKRHEKFVLMPDNKVFQVQNPRSFSVLCFTNSSNVPEYIMRGDACYCVLPDGTPESNEAMAVLVDCLAQQNKYVIARRVYQNNFVPKIVVLVPKPDHNPKCFFLASLPFADDIRCDYKEQNVEEVPRAAVVDEVYKFLDSINIESDQCAKKFPLGITMMLDSNSQKLINKAADKHLEKCMNLEEVDTDYLMEGPSGDSVANLKKIWEQREVTETKKDNVENDYSDFEW